jgi:hypothetical protein
MVEREANIDLLFRNGLRDFEALPPADLWEKIKPAVSKPKRSFFYLRIAASVTILAASGLLTAMLLRNSPSLTENASISLNSRPEPDKILRENIVAPVRPVALQPVDLNETDQKSTEEVKATITPVSLFTLPSPALYTSFIKSKPVREINRNITSGSLQKAYNPSYSDIVSEASVQVKENIPVKENKWSVGAMVTPAYYSQVSLSQDDAAKSIIKSEEPAFSYTGGLTFAYNISSRFTVQTGVNYSSVGQKIDGVDSWSGFGKFVQSKGGNEFQVMTSSGTISSTNSDIYLSDNNSGARVMSLFTREVFDPVKNDLPYVSSSLTQNFNYVEVPVLLKYKIIDRNVDLKVIGGVSYNILVNNNAYTTSGGTKYFIGKTDGLSPVTLSSSLGMGMEYSFSGKLSLNLEPTFRYYITPLGGLAGSSIHPYSFGILTGVAYKF